MKFDKDTRLILWGKGGPECHTSEFPFGIYWWTLKNPKNQNFEKIKKNCWRYHHFIHVYQKPQSNEIEFLRYRVRQSFWSIFCLFTLFTTRKIKILQKYKKTLVVSSFYTSVPKILILFYTVPEIWCVTDVTAIFYFGLFFAFLPPNQPKKIKIKKKKKSLEILSFYTCVPKIMIRWCTVPEIWCVMDGRMDERMNRWTEKVTFRGGSPT